MESVSAYYVWLMALAAVCAFMYYKNQAEASSINYSDAFKKFQRQYLLVYLIMMMADWMQGPYVYALYNHYGFSKGDIGILFIAGFGSSLVFGTVVGGFADRFGRKANCLLFVVLYSLSCVTKHFNDFNILMFGRLTGGISTSILYSAFETWMIHEHKAAGYEDSWMSSTFSQSTFYSSVVAIAAGLIATPLTNTFGLVAPFDASMTLLVIGGFIIVSTWRENYGDQSAARSGNNFENFSKALTILTHNRKVLLLGIVQSCFEAAMYIFVFMWTPALEATVSGTVEKGSPAIPHGVIFSGFMVAIMIGSKLFELLVKPGASHGPLGFLSDFVGTSVESFTRWIFVAGAAALALPIVTGSHMVILLGFSFFELCCGIYFPAVGTIRSRVIPEEVRSTIMNVFRVGLNGLVVVTLLYIDQLANETVFLFCTFLLTIATWAAHSLFALQEANAPVEERRANGLDIGEEMDQQLAGTKPDLAA